MVSDGVMNKVSDGLMAAVARDTRHQQKRKLSAGTKKGDDDTEHETEKMQQHSADVSRSMNAFLCCEYLGKVCFIQLEVVDEIKCKGQLGRATEAELVTLVTVPVEDGNSGDSKWRFAFEGEDEDDFNSHTVNGRVLEDDRKVNRSLDRGIPRVNPEVLEAAVGLLDGGDLLGAPKMNGVIGQGSQSCWARSAMGNRVTLMNMLRTAEVSREFLWRKENELCDRIKPRRCELAWMSSTVAIGSLVNMELCLTRPRSSCFKKWVTLERDVREPFPSILGAPGMR